MDWSPYGDSPNEIYQFKVNALWPVPSTSGPGFYLPPNPDPSAHNPDVAWIQDRSTVLK